MRALIVVDVQNDFLPGGALPIAGGDVVIPIINGLLSHYDLVVATLDWHPLDHGSFAVNHEGNQVGDVIDLHGLPQVLWPVHCVQGTGGANFPPQLDFGSIAKVFRKGTNPEVDSYSGFFDNGRREDTGLADFLRDEGVTEVHIVGLATDYCVKHTALDAVAFGFRTTVIHDACRGVNLHEGDVERALEEMERAGVTVQDSQECLDPGKPMATPAVAPPGATLNEVGAATPETPSREVTYSGRFLRMVNVGGWEFATRTNASAVVVIVATHDGNVLLVQQHRPPANADVLELPAGLVGDGDDADESMLVAAQRELLEEGGYVADDWTPLRACYSSPGMTDELLQYYWARTLTEVNEGGGVGAEQITRHWVPLDQVERWLDQKQQAGVYTSNMVPAGIRLMLEQVMRGGSC